MKHIINFLLVISIGLISCLSQEPSEETITPGAERTSAYIPKLKKKNIAVVANHTSLVDSVHLVDTLRSMGIRVIRIFSPEHGFRGTGAAGETMKNYTDEKTGLPVISLYGESKKPRPDDLKDIDVVVFDIQDVGVRFYTYISTMHYVMEACAETGTDFLVLDRPNPNGFYIDGPILDTQYRSFVGMHRIPIVYGMTIAELGRMINQEGWLKNGIRCNYQWIACDHYTHDSLYHLPVKPSPNLSNMRSIYLYPSLCLFEGTIVSVGRGTEFPFEVFGHPDLKNSEIQFTPKPIPGASNNPKFKNQICRGIDLRDYPVDSLIQNPGLRLKWLRFAYQNIPADDFFNDYFTSLAGNEKLMKMLKQGMTELQIRNSWQEDLSVFKEKRKKYLIYVDFAGKKKAGNK
jgi:uncharacterized protein YbbC (DUF1343 family)